MTTTDLHPDFREFLRCLNSQRVRYVVVGAHALAVLGVPRFTRDLDVLVEPSASNAKRVSAALREFGFSKLAAAVLTHLAVPDHMVTLGREPLRIDILSSIAAVSFAAAWRGRKRVRVDGITVPFLGASEMRRVKRAVGRAKDRADLALLDELTARPRAPRRAPRAVSSRAKRR